MDGIDKLTEFFI